MFLKPFVIKLFFASIMCCFFIYCEKNETLFEATLDDTAKVSNLPQILETDLFMPDSIPDIINNRAVDMALEFKFSNIRILGVSKSNTPSYHIYYYNNNLIGLKAFKITLDNSKKNVINEKEVSLPYESNLSKSLSDYKCWELATIYSDPNYSGSSHTFTASTTTHGWYHRIIYDLDEPDQGCGDDYSGNFDNSFSSHRWQDDYYSPQYRICRPVALHAFDKTNRDQSGDHYKWEELDSHYTGFDSTEPLGDPCHQLNQEASWSYRSMNDKASSLDMFFRVFTPGDCI